MQQKNICIVTESYCYVIVAFIFRGGWFGIVVTLRKFIYVEIGIGDDLWRVYLPVFFHAIHPSLSSCNEYLRWFRPPLGKKRRVLRSVMACN